MNISPPAFHSPVPIPSSMPPDVLAEYVSAQHLAAPPPPPPIALPGPVPVEYALQIEALTRDVADRDAHIASLKEEVASLSTLGARSGVSREVELINAEHMKALQRLDGAEEARIASDVRVTHIDADCHRLRDELAGMMAEAAAMKNQAEGERLRTQELTRQIALRDTQIHDLGQTHLAAEGDLREQIRLQNVNLRRLEAELGGSSGEIHAHRNAVVGAETRLRAVTQDAEARYFETHHTVEQMRRALRASEAEASSARERLAQRDEEIKALQLSNSEWLRQFRKQRALLAEKMVEVDFLRNSDTSEVALAQLGMTPAQASNVRDSLRTPRAERIRKMQHSTQTAHHSVMHSYRP